MTVCKGYLKIIWRNMGQNLMYLAIVLFVTIGMASQTEKTQENIFSRGSVDIAIVDEDGGAAAEGVVRFLRKNNSVTLTDASAEALSRKLYYREIDFVIRIPEGFTESLFDLSADNENEELIVSSVPGSTEGQFMKAELSQFLNQMRALRISGMTDEEAADKASSLSDDEATVSIRRILHTGQRIHGRARLPRRRHPDLSAEQHPPRFRCTGRHLRSGHRTVRLRRRVHG